MRVRAPAWLRRPQSARSAIPPVPAVGGEERLGRLFPVPPALTRQPAGGFVPCVAGGAVGVHHGVVHVEQNGGGEGRCRARDFSTPGKYEAGIRGSTCRPHAHPPRRPLELRLSGLAGAIGVVRRQFERGVSSRAKSGTRLTGGRSKAGSAVPPRSPATPDLPPPAVDRGVHDAAGRGAGGDSTPRWCVELRRLAARLARDYVPRQAQRRASPRAPRLNSLDIRLTI